MIGFRGVSLALLLICAAYVSLIVLPWRALAEGTPRPLVLGWLEEALIVPERLRVHAKLDTGADTSSIHTESIKLFKRKNKEWVRFEVSNRYGELQTFERPLRRHAQIKLKGKPPQKRPVVKLGMCVGGLYEMVEFTLVNRSNFSSTALIGRNFLAGKVLVDGSSAYTSEISCEVGKVRP